MINLVAQNTCRLLEDLRSQLSQVCSKTAQEHHEVGKRCIESGAEPILLLLLLYIRATQFILSKASKEYAVLLPRRSTCNSSHMQLEGFFGKHTLYNMSAGGGVCGRPGGLLQSTNRGPAATVSGAAA